MPAQAPAGATCVCARAPLESTPGKVSPSHHLLIHRGKTNFFEKRVGDYQKANVMATVTNDGSHTMSFDEDF